MEGFLRGLILTVVAGIAAAATFTHVHDWTMANTPAGTSSLYGWGNAAITELLPAGALLEIRRRRRTGKSITMPLTLLIVFGMLSLTAQVASAQQSLFGWIVAAIPAVAFMLLVKMTLSADPVQVEHEQGAVPVPEQGEQVPVQPAVQVREQVSEPVEPVRPATRPALRSVDADDDADAPFWALVDELGDERPSQYRVRTHLRCGAPRADRLLAELDATRARTRAEAAV